MLMWTVIGRSMNHEFTYSTAACWFSSILWVKFIVNHAILRFVGTCICLKTRQKFSTRRVLCSMSVKKPGTNKFYTGSFVKFSATWFLYTQIKYLLNQNRHINFTTKSSDENWIISPHDIIILSYRLTCNNKEMSATVQLCALIFVI